MRTCRTSLATSFHATTQPTCGRTAPIRLIGNSTTIDANSAVKPRHPRSDGPSCTTRHVKGDPLLGQALDSRCYDYSGAALWNNRAEELWHVFTVYLRRNLAEMLGVPRSKLSKVLRVEYAKVAEYQVCFAGVRSSTYARSRWMPSGRTRGPTSGR